MLGHFSIIWYTMVLWVYKEEQSEDALFEKITKAE